MSSEIANYFFPSALALIAFFLIQFYNLVRKINDKTTDILIQLGKGEVQFKNIEEKIEWLENELERLKEYVYNKQPK